MAQRRKPIPKTQHEIATGKAKSVNRGKQIKRDDKTTNFYLGLYDIDEAVQYYFDNIIKSIGRFPHKEVLPTTAKQTTRMLKMVCKCGNACINSKGNPLTIRQSFTSAVENPIVCHSCMMLEGSYNPKFILQADDEAIQMAIEQKRREQSN